MSFLNSFIRRAREPTWPLTQFLFTVFSLQGVQTLSWLERKKSNNNNNNNNNNNDDNNTINN